jgi:hypothetical protein
MTDLIVCGFWADYTVWFPAMKVRCAHCPEELALTDRSLLAAGTHICAACFLRIAREQTLVAADPRAIDIAMGIAQRLVENHKRLAAIAAN